MAVLLHPSGLEKLEQELQSVDDAAKRRLLIDRLTRRYVFSDIGRAQTLLAEQEDLLREHPDPDLELNYHLSQALAANQQYDFSRAEKHFRRALQLVEERGDLSQQTEVVIDFAGTCMNLGRMEEAFQLLDRAKRLLKAFPEKRMQARLICREGFMMLHYGDYPKAAELLLQAEKAFTLMGHELAIKDFYFLTLIYSGLGRVYEQSEELEKSVKAFERVVQMAENMHLRARLSWHYLNAGKGFLALQDWKQAEAYFQKVLDATDDPSPGAQAAALANMGFCRLERKEFDKALTLFDRAERAYRRLESENGENLALIEQWRGRLYEELGKRKEALNHYTEAFKNALSRNSYRQLAGLSRDISLFYEQAGDFRNAYEYLLLHTQYVESHLEEVNKRLQLELEVKYEAEKRKQEAEMLQLQATQLQLKALRAQMNPHFLYNALNAIQNYITSNEVASAAKYLARFAKLMRQSLEYSDAEVISLEKEVDFLKDYLFINERLRFRDKLEFAVFLDEELEEDIIGVPTMIVQPYVENALEHGLRTKKKGRITVRFEPRGEHTLRCIVEDNGIGRQRARELQKADARYRNHQSMGTRITEERLRILGQSTGKGQMTVTTEDRIDPRTGTSAGTRVEIIIPVLDLRIR